MTAIAFHFGAPDKMAYTCRLLRKATAQGARLLVVADAVTCGQLDDALWGVGDTDFVTHAYTNDPIAVVRRSAVLLELDTTHERSAAKISVLVNLSSSVPAGFGAFDRLIEVVSTDEEDRQKARMRWKNYVAQGYAIERKDLQLKTEAFA